MSVGLGAIGVLVGTAALLTACGGSGTATVTVTTTTPSQSRPAASLSFPALVAKVQSGVIRIETTNCNGLGVGTGILISPTLIVTVEHVVTGATSIALLRNGRIIGHGTVIGSDPARDVALVRSSKAIIGYHFHLGSRAPLLGESVAAIGFPLALPLTVTRGSVSGLGRTIPISGVNRRNLVQTDAAVNPGNSGGPLVTDSGLVVGLVDLGARQANGVAFAVSATVAGPLIESWSVSPQPVPLMTCATSTPSTYSPPAGQLAAPADAVYTYWSLLQLGDYTAAFAELTPVNQQRLGGLAKFLGYFSGDPLLSVNVVVGVPAISGDTATVDVAELQTEGAATGCRNWSGSYQLAFAQGAWLIDYANLNYTAC